MSYNTSVMAHNLDLDLVKLDIDKLVLVLQQCLDKISHLTAEDKQSTLLTGNRNEAREQENETWSARKQFLESFQLFIECTRKQMEAQCVPTTVDFVTPSEDRDWEDKPDRKEEIQELKRKMETIKKKYEREEENKKQLIAEYQRAIELIEIKKKEELNEIAKRADEQMIQEWQAIEYELNNLQTEEKMVQRKYQHLCKENLLSENCLRQEKSKCENKLEEFIALYDKDLGKKQLEYENIVHQQELEKEQLISLTKLFESQKPRYQKMIEERSVWKEKELAKKLHKLRKMLAHNTISKFLNNYVKTLRENNVPIVVTKKSKGKKKKQ